jgi:hypothetical protein
MQRMFKDPIHGYSELLYSHLVADESHVPSAVSPKNMRVYRYASHRFSVHFIGPLILAFTAVNFNDCALSSSLV